MNPTPFPTIPISVEVTGLAPSLGAVEGIAIALIILTLTSGSLWWFLRKLIRRDF